MEQQKSKRKEKNKVQRKRIFKSTNKVEIVPGEMSDMDINTISLVRKGANKQKFQIYKEEGEKQEDIEEEEDEKQGLFEVLKSYFAGRVKKAEEKKATKTFAALMTVNDITENMWRANDTLRTVMRDIINNAEITDKKAALLQAVEEYAAYMKNKVNTSTIAKGDSFFDVPETEIQKAGKKVSSKNLEALKAAQQALATVIQEAEADGKGKEEEANEVKKEEMTTIMKQVLEQTLQPIKKRLDKIEKTETSEEEGSETIEHFETKEATELMKSILQEKLTPIENRLTQIEKSRGIARSSEGEESEGKIEKEADAFEGYFI